MADIVGDGKKESLPMRRLYRSPKEKEIGILGYISSVIYKQNMSLFRRQD